jgi:hypothetical protein
VPPLPSQYSIEAAVAAAFGTFEMDAGALDGQLSTHREGYGLAQNENCSTCHRTHFKTLLVCRLLSYMMPPCNVVSSFWRAVARGAWWRR